MNKRFDFSVLPDGFLIEQCVSASKSKRWQQGVNYYLLDEDIRQVIWTNKYRPTLTHWHFNDGLTTLPEGLIIQVSIRDSFGDKIKERWTANEFNGSPVLDLVDGFEIIGAHPDYGNHAKELGIEVMRL